MKSTLYLFFLLLLSFGLSAQSVKVMTYNIKYDNVNDTINNWNDRKVDMVKLMKHYQADFMGLQEVLNHQLNYLDNNLPEYAYVGVGRDDGKQKGEYSPILYNKEKFIVENTQTFWLSQTPDKISVGWDASMERICTYALFSNKTDGKKIYVFNTHFDHIGNKAREESAKLIYAKIEAINSKNYPVVVMGDLNLTPDTTPIQFLQTKLTDGLTATKQDFYGPSGTFSGFNWNKTLNHRIDYIFIKNLSVLNYIHIDDRMENNKHISDHLPVLATLTF